MSRALVFSLDDNYVLPFKVFFNSLLLTDSIPSFVGIYILHSHTLAVSSRDDILRFLAKSGYSPNFLDIDSSIPAGLPLNHWDHVSIAAYFRLFLADILPADVDHAVYLDSDMLAIRSIRELFSIDCSSLLAAVDHFAPDEGIRLWGPVGGSYFQSGVLIIPLAAWRQAAMLPSFLDVIANKVSRIQWHDQDVLNIVIGERWQRLPIWYNLCHESLRFVSADEVAQSGILIHFNGRYKPWNSFNRPAYTAHWYRAYQQTFGHPFDRASLDPWGLNRLKRLIKRMFRIISGHPWTHHYY